MPAPRFHEAVAAADTAPTRRAAREHFANWCKLWDNDAVCFLGVTGDVARFHLHREDNTDHRARNFIAAIEREWRPPLRITGFNPRTRYVAVEVLLADIARMRDDGADASGMRFGDYTCHNGTITREDSP